MIELLLVTIIINILILKNESKEKLFKGIELLIVKKKKLKKSIKIFEEKMYKK